MIRLIIDKLGSGHHDLFLKIDLLPSYSKTADSYYLQDFLEIENSDIDSSSQNQVKIGAIELIKYWKENLIKLENGKTRFLTFDLSDQYIGGILFKKVKLGFQITVVNTTKLHGYEVCKSNINNLINVENFDFEKETNFDWIIGEEALYHGLDWSINEILK